MSVIGVDKHKHRLFVVNGGFPRKVTSLGLCGYGLGCDVECEG